VKFYGHANLQQNELQNAVLSTLTTFPPNAKVGQIAFLNRIVYICVQVTPAPAIWVPMTNEITAYTHLQESPTATWTVTHSLNTTSVNVQVYDGNSLVIIPDSISTVSANVVSITFGTPVSGRAVVVTGHFDGNVKPTYAYTHFQTSASTDWVINHNLGYEPIIRVFLGTQEVQPSSITHNTLNQTTITFTTAVAGTARLI
jgi:hypothetical protein